MKRAALALVLVAGVAHADGPPSPALQRAIKLYDREDYLSASIEFGKVLEAERAEPRAEFFLAKSVFKLHFEAASLGGFARIFAEHDHPYRMAALKWIVAALDTLGGGVDGLGTLTPNDTDDPTFGPVADDLRWYGGLAALQAHDVSGADAFFARVTAGSKHDREARAERAWIVLQQAIATSDPAAHVEESDALFALASKPDHASLALGRETIHRLATWAWYLAVANRASYEHVRGQLDELKQRDATAAFAVSRLALQVGDATVLGIADVPTFEAIAVGAACENRELPATLVATRARIAALRARDPVELGDKIAAEPLAIRALADTRAIREARAWQTEVAAELARIYKMDKAWQTTAVAAEVLQDLTVQSSIAQAVVGKLLADTFAAADRELANLEPALAGRTVHGLVVNRAMCGVADAPIVRHEPPPPPPAQAHGCAGCAGGPGDGGLVAGVIALAFARRRRAR